jgi:DNA modification methylase
MAGALRHDLTIQTRPISELTPWAKNPRDNDAAAEELAYTISEVGWTNPILLDKHDTIIAGHTRLKAALKLGLTEVPTITLDVDGPQAELIAIADNRLAEFAEWDKDALAEILESLQAEGIDTKIAGYGDDDLSDLLASLDSDPIGPDDIEPEAPPEDPDSKRGEVYELGPHRLICGDCRDPDTVTALLDGRKINVAFTSPPYASQRKYDESSGFKPIHPDEYVEWFDAVQANVREHLADDGSWFVNIKEHCDDGQRSLYVKDLTLAHVRRWGWRFVDEFAWTRPSPPGAWPDRFKNGFEPVFHFSMARVKFRPESVGHPSGSVPVPSSKAGANKSGPNGEYWNLSLETSQGLALPSNVIKVSGVAPGTGHTAAFPVALPAFFIRAFSDASDAIFDPFLGSGTTLIAAAKEGRACYGVEISEGYCDVIRKRWTAWAKEAGQDPGPGALD